MDPYNGVLDISSDEEPDARDQQMNLDWLCDQLFQNVDDSDDVVVVGEVLNSKQGVNKCLSSPVAASNADERNVQKGDEEEDDDDCVVLEGDPDKMVAVEESREDGSDELVVVGEKGQVACRDYPHSRHLCVKYPFSSTLHKFHCELCHCFVCDTVAPCNLWGTGMSIADHCHATDKLDVWKTERKNFKLKRCSSLPAIKMSEHTSSLVSQPMLTQIPRQSHPLTRSITMPNNHDSLRSVPAVHSMPSVPAIRSVPSAPAIRIVPSVPNLGVSNMMNPKSGCNRFPQSSISQQSPGGCTKYISQKDGYKNPSSLGPQAAVFKRTSAYRPAYRSGYAHPHTSIRSYAQSTPWNQPVRGESTNRDYHPHQWINSASNMNTGSAHNPLPQSHYVDTLSTSAAYHYVTTNQPIKAILGSSIVNQQVTFPSDMTASICGVSVPLVDYINSSTTQLTQDEFASLPNVPTPWADTANSNSIHWDQLQRTEVASNPGVPIPWVDNSNFSQSNQATRPEASGFQGQQSVNAVSNDYQPSEDSLKVSTGPDNHATPVPEMENLHFEFEDWLMDNQAAVGHSSEPPLYSDQNILSPDDAHIDTDLLYDDEWNTMASIADM
ncbi:unnamed protein product [Rhodiola kirilowii]